MKPLRNGDLTDAAELIDSAQGCAKLLAQCCAEKDAEIARLWEAIKELDDSMNEFARCKDEHFKAALDRMVRAEGAVRLIAREEGK